MAVIDRTIERYDDFNNITFFMHGDKPVANILVDEENGVVYKCFGENYRKEKMFMPIPINDF